MAETKPKLSPSLRTPKPKKLGLAVPPALRLPHDELIKAEFEETQALVPTTMPSQTSQTSDTSLTSHSSQTSQTRHTAKRVSASTPATEEVPVSPVRDYTKVANSIRREAVPAGLFKGKSKQLYDELYALTRGAVVPKRKVRISRPKLMKLANIGSRVTFDTNINHLSSVGLIDVIVLTGEHEGNEYEVYIPEEVESMPSQTSQASQTSLTSHAQKVDRLVSLETSQTRHTLSVENTEGYVGSKTSFKTNTEKDDDEAFAPMLAQLRRAAKEITGREPSAAEADRWREFGELLVTELKIAAGRTTVSSVPSFFTEHLRRRLWKKERRQIEAENASSGQQTPTAATPEEVSKCPDCYGTGMWYPEGYEKGVAKCMHRELTQAGKGSE